jgi:Uma2 family endonuclease
VSEYRFPKTVRDVLRSWGFREDGDGAQHLFDDDTPMPSEQGAVPILVIEARSPTDSWGQATVKAVELLVAGVWVVCVLAPKEGTARIYREGEAIPTLRRNDELTFPDLLPGFSVRVGEFFA